jgi:hypothetical protein
MSLRSFLAFFAGLAACGLVSNGVAGEPLKTRLAPNLGDIADLRIKYRDKWNALIPSLYVADLDQDTIALLCKVWRTLGKRVAPKLANTTHTPGRIAQIILHSVNDILKECSEGDAIIPEERTYQ